MESAYLWGLFVFQFKILCINKSDLKLVFFFLCCYCYCQTSAGIIRWTKWIYFFISSLKLFIQNKNDLFLNILLKTVSEIIWACLFVKKEDFCLGIEYLQQLEFNQVFYFLLSVFITYFLKNANCNYIFKFINTNMFMVFPYYFFKNHSNCDVPFCSSQHDG